MWWFDIPIHCEKISTIWFINSSITSHIFLFSFFLVRTFKFYGLSKFQLCNAVITIVTILWSSSDRTHLITESFYLLPSSPCPLNMPQTLATTFLLWVWLSFTNLHIINIKQYLSFSFYLISLGIILSRSTRCCR